MRDTIALRCDECGKVHWYTTHFLQGVIRGMKLEKSKEVVLQLQEKRGPFYDRWLAAMEARGEQKRCKDCVHLDEDHNGIFCGLSLDYNVNKSPGCFACSQFEQKWTD